MKTYCKLYERECRTCKKTFISLQVAGTECYDCRIDTFQNKIKLLEAQKVESQQQRAKGVKIIRKKGGDIIWE